MTTLTSTVDPEPTSIQLDSLLRPSSIAIVGASSAPATPSANVISSLRNYGYGGAVHLISRTRDEVLGQPTLSSVEDLPEAVDCAVLCVPRAGVLATLRACGQKSVKAAIVFASGFGEHDAEGQADQDELVRIAQEHGIAVLGPNCFGLHNFVRGVPIELIGVLGPDPDVSMRNVAIVGQSGGLASMCSWALRQQHGIGPTLLVSTGNEAMVAVEDVLMDVVDDDTTTVIAIVAETLRKPRLFLRAAARARDRGKPIVLLHPGKSERAREAALSHTGAIAGDYEVMRTLAAAEGVIVVGTFGEWTTTVGLLCHYPRPPIANGVGVITGSGGFRGIALDLAASSDIDLPELAPPTIDALAELFDGYGKPDNPLDLTTRPVRVPDMYGRAYVPMSHDPGIGSVLFATLGPTAMNLDLMQRALPFARGSDTPLVCAMLTDSSLVTPEFLQVFRAEGVPYFRAPEAALQALGRLSEYGQLVRRANRTQTGLPTKTVAVSAGSMTEVAGKAVLAEAGIRVPAGQICADVAAAREAANRVGFPVALKIQALDVNHKSDAGGVILGITDGAQLDLAWQRLHANVRRAVPEAEIDGVLVEAMAAPGQDFIIGARRHPDWGPMLMVGLGGIWAEALGDVRLMSLAVEAQDVEQELRRLRAARLLDGYRGEEPLDVDALVESTLSVAALMRGTPEIVEIDINPLRVFARGHGAVALDALIVGASS